MWTRKRLGQEEESGVPLGQASACSHCPPCTQHHTQPPPPPEVWPWFRPPALGHRAAQDSSVGHSQA